MSVQSIIILQVKYCEKENGIHILFLSLEGIVLIMSLNSSLWRTKQKLGQC